MFRFGHSLAFELLWVGLVAVLAWTVATFLIHAPYVPAMWVAAGPSGSTWVNFNSHVLWVGAVGDVLLGLSYCLRAIGSKLGGSRK